MLKHGRLVPRSQDLQRTSTLGSRLSFIAFVVLVPLLHWAAVLRYTGGARNISYDGITAYDILGSLCIVGAVLLVGAAARDLGKAYDRIAAPDMLVTAGSYRLIRHPIYTSYMMLFSGHCLLLHSAPLAIIMLGVCIAYYRCMKLIYQWLVIWYATELLH